MGAAASVDRVVDERGRKYKMVVGRWTTGAGAHVSLRRCVSALLNVVWRVLLKREMEELDRLGGVEWPWRGASICYER